MKLSISDRLTILGLMPGRATETEIMIVADIREKVELSADEQEKAEFKTSIQDGQVMANYENNFEIEIEISSAEMDFIKKHIDRMSKEEKLTHHMVPTIRKIRNANADSKEK